MTRRRLRGDGSGLVPVVLPLVLIRTEDGDTVTITLDAHPVADAAVPRAQLGEALTQIVDQLATPVRVEVHEPDGTVHADILTPPTPQPTGPPPTLDHPHASEPPAQPQAWTSGPGQDTDAHIGVPAEAAADTGRRRRLHHDGFPAPGRRGPTPPVGTQAGASRGQELA
ncbi:MAG: hypothetical protein KG028_05940 [Actinobacteria bacterium]|jgi:hypothetical protein|nr:hypothetical protein [Actinomycetota bacterium]